MHKIWITTINDVSFAWFIKGCEENCYGKYIQMDVIGNSVFGFDGDPDRGVCKI